METAEKEIKLIIANRQKFNYQEVNHYFFSILKRYEKIRIIKDYQQLNIFLSEFLTDFCRESFVIPSEWRKEYISLNPLIAKLIEVSELDSADDFIPEIFNDVNNLTKVLTLYSPLSKKIFTYGFFFEIDPILASHWYWTYFDFKDYLREVSQNNLQRHLEKINDLPLSFPEQPSAAFYLSTYLNPDQDRLVKKKINGLIQEYINKNTPPFSPKVVNNKKIGLISAFFYPEHSVFRATNPFLEKLAETYELTLIHLGKPFPGLSFSPIFKKVIYLSIKLKTLAEALAKIREADFSMLIFIDNGMSAESILLSNCRLNRIQLSLLGHSVSSWGAEIDFLISGKDNEKENGNENYSEKLRLVNGMGLISDYRFFETQAKNNQNFILICPWSMQKINRKLLLFLKKIQESSEKKVFFRFLTSIRDFYFQAYEAEIASVLGKDNFERFGSLGYENYLKHFSTGHLVIDSFHFGGYNTIIDSLLTKIPVITFEGDFAYNRFASGLLRKAGLDELITTSEDDYLQLAISLINDSQKYHSVIQKMNNLNLSEIFNNDSEKISFKNLIDLIIKYLS